VIRPPIASSAAALPGRGSLWRADIGSRRKRIRCAFLSASCASVRLPKGEKYWARGNDVEIGRLHRRAGRAALRAAVSMMASVNPFFSSAASVAGNLPANRVDCTSSSHASRPISRASAGGHVDDEYTLARLKRRRPPASNVLLPEPPFCCTNAIVRMDPVPRSRQSWPALRYTFRSALHKLESHDSVGSPRRRFAHVAPLLRPTFAR